MMAIGSNEFKIQAACTIQQIEQQWCSLLNIHSILKPREPPIAFVIKDGIYMVGAEMNEAFVKYNEHYFNNPQNGASAAILG